jgi:HlyD family secretion protein
MSSGANSPRNESLLPDTRRQDRLLPPAGYWRRHRRLWLAAAAGFATLGVLAWALARFSGARDSVDRGQLTIAPVVRGAFVRDIAADGQVVAAVSPTIYAPSPGTVTLKVHAGDAVEKDQLLAVIDSPDLGARLAQEQATLESLHTDWERARLDATQKLAQLRAAYEQAQIDGKTAQRELDRSRKAYELGSFPELQVMKSQDQLEKARFAQEQAQRSYESQPKQNRFEIDSKHSLWDRQKYLVTDLERQLAACQIRAPVAGRVGQVQVEDRANVTRDTPLMSVVDLSAMEVEIKVPENLARDLVSGMSADLGGDGGRWKGTVGAISPQVVNGEVVARLRFADQRPVGLRQNQRLSVRIFIDRRDHVLMVDHGSFYEQDGGGFVYVVKDGVAQRRAVRLGAVSTQKVEVLDGLQEGEQIVVAGTESLHAAARVILTH